MTTTASTEWWKEFGLDTGKSSSFFTGIEQIDARTPQPHTLRRAFKQLDLDGILCQDKSPLIYFRCVERMDSGEIERLRKRFWNHGVAPILVLISRDEVQIYSSLNRDVGLVDTLNRVSDELQSFLFSVESGEFFHTHREWFDPNQRVDRELLKNLQATREELDRVTNPHIAPQSLDALLCRLVFTCYLFDRGVILPKYLEDIGIEEAEHLRDILARKPRTQAKTELYVLFKQLGEDFNGDLFSDDLDAEARQIKANHLDILDRFFHATGVRSGQQSLWHYDFGVIPIETISAIYERFLKAAGEEKKKKAGAFYTPRFLAEIVLDMTLDGTTSLLEKRFLDPACGSGIFLVGLFHQLAEEWRRANPRARYERQATELMRILTENLYGVDSNPTACRITAFSLCLAFLDQLLPPDIQQLQSKGKLLPLLVWSPDGKGKQGSTIRHADFFTDEASPPNKVHIVVGNPPWGSTATAATAAGQWCAAHAKPLPDKQISTAFVWKAPEHLATGGKVCFVLPYGVLFHHSGPALKFQKEWFLQHAVERILNLADYQFFLFEESRAPAVVVRYAKEKPSGGRHAIDYWGPKADWTVTKAEIISVLPQDCWRITVREVMDDLSDESRDVDAPQIWKSHYWATPRDRRLLDRLLLMPRLRNHVRQPKEKDPTKPWLIAEGFQPIGPSDDPEYRKAIFLPSKWFIGARSKTISLILLEDDCKELPSETLFVRSKSNKNTTIFNAPHVLVNEGFSKVAFADFPVSFQDKLRGIHGPSSDREILQFLAAYLRSPLARYFQIHTSSNWGVGWQVVDMTELLRTPFPLPESTHNPKRCREIVGEVAKIVSNAASQSMIPQADREGIVRNAQASANKLIEEYFDLNNIERILVADTCEIIIPSVRPSQKLIDVPTILPSDKKHRDEYIHLLCDTLNGWADKNQQVHGESVVSDSIGVGLVVLEKTRRGQAPGRLPESTADVLTILNKLQRTAAIKHTSLELVRGLKVFDGDMLYITKPLGQRFWTRTAALNDADEIVGSILMQPGRGNA